MKSLKVEVDRDVWLRMNAAMKDALDNTRELLNKHEADMGGHPENKRDKAIRSMFEREIAELDDLINYSDKNNGVPF